MSYINILHALGWLLVILAAAMCLPVVSAIAYEEHLALSGFLTGVMLTAFCGGGLVLLFREARQALSNADQLLLVSIMWIVIAVFAAWPISQSLALPHGGHAIFEALSGITTTGFTLIEHLDEVPRSVILWRALLQWLGGVISIVAIAAVLAPQKIAGLELRLTPLARGENVNALHRLGSTTREVFNLMAILTVACFFAIWASGVPAFDAFCLSLSTLSTGGFTPRDAGISAYNAPYAQFWMVIFMLLGAMSFTMHRQITRAGIREAGRDPELIYLLSVFLIAGAILSCWFLLQSDVKGLSALTGGYFMAASMLSTSGFVPAGFENVEISPVVITGLALLGGATMSTAGGIKLMRLALLLKQSSRELARLAHPSGIIPSQFGGRAFTIQTMKTVWAFFVAYIVVLGLVALAVSLTEVDAAHSIIAAVAALTNVGPLYDMVTLNVEHGQSVREFHGGALWAISVAMVLGRVELIAVLCVLSLNFWRR